MIGKNGRAVRLGLALAILAAVARANGEEAGLAAWSAAVAARTYAGAAPAESAGDEEAKGQLLELLDKAAPVSLKTLGVQAPELLPTGGEVWSMVATGDSVVYTLAGRRRGDRWEPVYFCATGLAAVTGATFDDARARMLAVVLHDGTDGVEVSALPRPVTDGSPRLETWGHVEVDMPWDDGWVFLVDDAPPANWTHPCRYVFVASDLSAVAVQYAVTPLSVRPRTPTGEDDEFQVIIPFARESVTAVKKKPSLQFPGKTVNYEGSVSNCYAVIISGGYNEGNNHIRYWGDAAFIYSTLTLKYGYPKTNIYTLISDGTNTAVDRSDETDSPTDLDGDGLVDTYGAATVANVSNVFIALQSILHSNDQLFVFSTDHGGEGSGERAAVLYLWGGLLHDYDMKALTEPIPCPVIFAMEQCFSGGFIDDLNQSNRAIATAAPYDDYSYAGDTYPEYDQWSYYWTAAMRGFFPQTNAPWIDAGACDADANEDGHVSFEEAYDYAMDNRYPDDHPAYGENPAGLGRRMFLSLPARENLGVGELAMDPVPSALGTNVPFAVRITARNVFGDVMTNYAGPAMLWAEGAPNDSGRYVGTGTATWDYPFHTWYMDARVQVIYPAALLGEARTLDHLELDVVTCPSMTMSNWTIRIKHTALDSYPASPQWESTGWTVVYASNQTISTTGWVTFAFSLPFDYDGAQNLMVDFSYNNDEYAEGYGICRASTSASPVSLYFTTDSEYGDPLTWSNNVPSPNRSYLYPNLRFGPPPTPAEVQVEPTNLTGFVDGVWTGMVTALTTNSGTYLWVSDTTQAWRGCQGPIRILSQCLTNYVDAAGTNPIAPYASWANAATTIQDAVNAAFDGHTVMVTNGTYAGGGVPAPGSALTNRVCVTNAITVRSVNGAGFTTIRGSGGLHGDAAVRGVFLTNGAALIGFTMADGRTRADSGDDGCGGGLFMTAGTTAGDCVLTGNQAYAFSGGAHLSFGGTLYNGLLRGNSGEYCGGAGLYYGGTLNNCTVYGNTGAGTGAPEISGGVTVLGAGTLNNCIVWGNISSVSTDIYNSGGTVHNTCAGDGVTDGVDGNVLGDPAFRNAGAGNYRLLTASPCVDTGDNACAPTNATPFDLLGQPRVVNGVVDMGAFEWQGPTCSVLGTNNAVIADGEAASAAKGTDLGVSGPGIAVTRILSITNNGDGVLTLAGCATTGVHAASFHCPDLPSYIEPFTASNFTVTLVPLTTGSLAAAVAIANDSTNSSYTVNLAGSSRALSAIATNVGPHAGGNELTVTFGFSATVTNVLVGTNRWPATVSASGTNWVAIVLPEFGGGTGTVRFTLQSLEYGEFTLTNTYTYNPAGAIGGYIPNRWVNVAPLPGQRAYLAAVTFSNEIYAIGGFDESGVEQDTVYRFDGTNWAETTPMPTSNDQFGCAVWNGAIYTAGSGKTNVYRYDGASWTETAGLTVNPLIPLVTVFSNRLHVVTGQNYTNCFVYDGSAWTETAGLPGGVYMYGPAGGVLGDYLFVAGGTGTSGPKTNHFRFDGAAWTSVAGLPESRIWMGTAVWQDRIYAIGGYNATFDPVTNVFCFDGTNWMEDAGLPAHLSGCGAAVLSNELYCIGGYDSGEASSNVYKYAYGYPYLGVSPTNGSVAGRYEVTITGTHLGNGSDITNVTICGVRATNLLSQSTTQVVVMAGAAVGAVTGDVRVYSVSFGETVKSNFFAYTINPQMAVLGTNRQVVASGEATSRQKGTDFGQVRFGRAVTNAFAVTNSGDFRVDISAVTTNGDGASAFSIARVPSSVSPGAASNFTIAFLPPAVGVYTAALEIAHSATGSPYVVYIEGASYRTSTNSGSSDGGNTLVLTNGAAFGATVTNVLVCGVRATIVTQGTDWVEIRLGSGGNGTGNIVLQLASGGSEVYPNAYTYISSGGGGGGGEEPPAPAESGADFKIKQTAVTPSKPSCGGKFVVWVQVENKGTAKGDAGYVSLTVDGKLFGAVKVGTLDKKKTKVVKFTNVKTTKKYSPIALTFKVDCYNVTRETNESNNSATKNVSCK